MSTRPSLPPSIDSDALYAGEVPSILIDRALSLHSRNPNSSRTNAGLEEDSEDASEREAELVRGGEDDSLLTGNPDGDYARSRSSSKTARQNLSWYKRPSPAW